MKAFYAEEQRRHYPRAFLVNGIPRENPEQPERIDHLLAGALAAGLTIERPSDCGVAPILAVHDQRYVDFLQHAHDRWRRIDGASEAVTPICVRVALVKVAAMSPASDCRARSMYIGVNCASTGSELTSI